MMNKSSRKLEREKREGRNDQRNHIRTYLKDTFPKKEKGHSTRHSGWKNSYIKAYCHEISGIK